MMPGDVGVRRATLGDAAVISLLTTALGYPSSVEETTRRLQVLLPSEAHFIAVAEIDSRVIGWIAAERRLLLEAGERAEIVGLIVSSDVRRIGVGATLVRAAEAWAVERNLQVISVRSNVTRSESHPFYERLGYIRSKTQHAYSKRIGT